MNTAELQTTEAAMRLMLASSCFGRECCPVPPCACARSLIEAITGIERDRCYAIVERARFGEIDRDWRSILHRIECGRAANEE